MLEYVLPVLAVGLIYYSFERTRSWPLRAGSVALWLFLFGYGAALAQVLAADANSAAEAVKWMVLSLATLFAPLIYFLVKAFEAVKL